MKKPRPARRCRSVRRPLILSDGDLKPLAACYAKNLLMGSGTLLDPTPVLHALDGNELVRRFVAKAVRGTEDIELSDVLRRVLKRVHRQARGKLVVPGDAPGPLGDNLATLADMLELGPVDCAVLQFLVVHRLVTSLESLTSHECSLTFSGAAAVVAFATALPRRDVMVALSPGAPLLHSGLLKVDNGRFSLENKLELSATLVDTLTVPGLDRDGIVDRFLPSLAPPTLGLDAYEPLARAIATAEALLRGAIARRQRGVNVLFYGPTGTGKTELARLLATRVGTRLYQAGREDAQGDAPSAQERLASLMLGNRLLGQGAVLLFDELEDLFEAEWRGFPFGGASMKARMSKLWFNLLLETNPVPTIWITNQTSGIDPAFLRRFSFAIELRELGRGQRRRAWEHHLGTAHRLSVADVDSLAERFIVSPAQIATAVGAARLVAPDGGPDRAALEDVTAPLEKLVSGRDVTRIQIFDARAYRPEALTTPVDVGALAKRLEAWQPGQGGISLCLYGPSGTGKSELVKYLAWRMGRPVLVKRVSDLQSPWVGVCEQNIAAAFRQSEEDRSVLLFDEADSVLRDRRGAERSWEVSQVNEFLQQLEASTGIVACTTNLFRQLDQAALRRFVFKIPFSYLRPEQAMLLLQSQLGEHLPGPLEGDAARAVARELSHLHTLTPGDFAAVRRRLRALDLKATPEALVAELRAEVQVKDAAPRAIGF